jgi:7-cyano-7-deazaguanine synthase
VSSEARGALVLFSGGQDSTVCLAYALDRYAHVETIGFDGPQRQPAERESRLQVRSQLRKQFGRWAPRLGEDHVLDLTLLEQIGGTVPTAERESAMSAGGLTNSFVPGRNLLFFTFAANVAERRGLSVLVGGMCETDFSAYPDCRDNALKSLQVALSLGLDTAMTIDTPLMWLDKAETWALTEKIGGEPLIDLVVEHTHSCYLGDREHRHDWGYGCGMCPSCDLRGKGYRTWLAS